MLFKLRFFLRARDEYKVRYVRCLVSSVKELQQTKNLRLRYRADDGRVQEEDFDLVVLSAGLKPAPEAIEMARKLGVELNQYNFCRLFPFPAWPLPPRHLCGRRLCGTEGHSGNLHAGQRGAAGEAAALLAAAKNTLVTEKEFPPEQDVRAEEPRIEVFVCRCSINIGSVVDVPAVVARQRNFLA